MKTGYFFERAARVSGVDRAAGLRLAATVLVVLCTTAATASAQYFGRNKVQYQDLDFRVMHTDHFDIHFYPEEETAVRDAARMAERWYVRLSRLFNHEFRDRKPIVLYASQGDFQQTNTIFGEIGEGTGGVTEPLKDRVILPLAGVYAETDHVMGHELVHAFQYDIAGDPQGGGLDAMSKLPLWFIEGLAEYLSIGREDPNTAMWLRDAVLRDDVPTLEQLSGNMRYFPYRYGQAVWAYVAGRWGDRIIGQLYRSALQRGLPAAIRATLGMTQDSLSADWIAAVKSTYNPLLADRRKPAATGTPVLGRQGERGLNIAPSISPDGRYVAYLSSRGLFSIDLYLADARTGEVLKRLVSTTSDPHFESLRFINSAGSWSPDGRKFAFVVFTEGSDEIAILDVESRDVERQFRAQGVRSINNPSWSPDGARLVFSGTHGGITDLYLVDIVTTRIEQLTNDRYGDLQPVWSPDGRTIAFASDRGDVTSFADLTYGELGISIVDVTSRQVRTLPLARGAKQINPQYSPDGSAIYFISDMNGFSDIYRYGLATGAVDRLTTAATGVSGIGASSPAMSVALRSGRIMFSVFDGGSYTIHAIDPDAAAMTPEQPVTGGGSSSVGGSVAGRSGGPAPAGILPPASAIGEGEVARYLNDPATGLPPGTDFAVSDYAPSLRLDYIGSSGVGVAVNGGFGSQLGGGVNAYLSDMLGNHQLGLGLQMNGTFADIGGQVSYQNQEHRWNWGVSAGHMPYLSLVTSSRPVNVRIDSTLVVPGEEFEQRLERVFVDGGSVMALYPFSQTRRFEISAGYTHYGYDVEVIRQTIAGNTIVGETVEDAPAPSGLNFFQTSTAFVGDNSFFGFTSPVVGSRFRLELGGTFGSLTIGSLLADYRHYFFWNPLTIALRAFHYGRYGPDAESDRLTPLFVGQPSLVRGYEPTSFDASECSGTGENGRCPEFDRLIGSRLGVVSAELRIPVLGSSDLGLINFPYIPVEISGFVDAGVAWTGEEAPVFSLARSSTDRTPVASVGISGRANLFGYLVLEVYYAYPFQRPEKGAHFGFQIAPGW